MATNIEIIINNLIKLGYEKVSSSVYKRQDKDTNYECHFLLSGKMLIIAKDENGLNKNKAVEELKKIKGVKKWK